MGKLGMEKRLSLLRKYMVDAPDDTERFWAHAGLVSSLTCLAKNREAVEEHFRLYHWASEHLPDKYALETLSILSVADCLMAEGRIDDWILLYEAAAERLDNPEISQYTRCEFLQIGAEVLRANDQFDAALLEIEKLERANKGQGWKHYFRFWLAIRTNRLLVYGKQEDWERYDQIYTEANTYMEGELKKRDAGQPVNLDDLMWFTHDFGGFLVSLKKYNEAKRFLQVCLDLEDNNYYAHFQLAVSIWGSEKDREKTLQHLKVAQDYYVVNPYNYQDTYYPTFLKTPEFSDVKDDPEFLKVLGQK